MFGSITRSLGGLLHATNNAEASQKKPVISEEILKKMGNENSASSMSPEAISLLRKSLKKQASAEPSITSTLAKQPSEKPLVSSSFFQKPENAGSAQHSVIEESLKKQEIAQPSITATLIKQSSEKPLISSDFFQKLENKGVEIPVMGESSKIESVKEISNQTTHVTDGALGKQAPVGCVKTLPEIIASLKKTLKKKTEPEVEFRNGVNLKILYNQQPVIGKEFLENLENTNSSAANLTETISLLRKSLKKKIGPEVEFRNGVNLTHLYNRKPVIAKDFFKNLERNNYSNSTSHNLCPQVQESRFSIVHGVVLTLLMAKIGYSIWKAAKPFFYPEKIEELDLQQKMQKRSEQIEHLMRKMLVQLQQRPLAIQKEAKKLEIAAG